MENVTKALRANKIYIPSNKSLCYQHSYADTLEISMEVFCDEPSVGNQIRLELSNKTNQLVLCDLRIYGGNCILICLRQTRTF